MKKFRKTLNNWHNRTNFENEQNFGKSRKVLKKFERNLQKLKNCIIL